MDSQFLHPSKSTKRFSLMSPIDFSKNSKKKLITCKKKQVNPRVSLKPLLSSVISSTENLISDYSLNNSLILPQTPIQDKEYLELKLKFDEFLKQISNEKDENRFSTELKCYTCIILSIGNIIKPYGIILKTIAENLNKYIENYDHKSNVEYKIQNDKLMHKLEVLSAENIEFYKRIEELKNELSLKKKVIAFNEAPLAMEHLIKEIAMQSDYITKCNNEIQEYKTREYDLLKKLEFNKDMLIKSKKNKKDCDSPLKRAQTLFAIPRLTLIQKSQDPH